MSACFANERARRMEERALFGQRNTGVAAHLCGGAARGRTSRRTILSSVFASALRCDAEMNVQIRPMTAADWPSVATIYAEGIATGHATFAETPPDSFADFAKDPEWTAARTESEKDGKLVDKVDSVFLSATDYSPIK